MKYNGCRLAWIALFHRIDKALIFIFSLLMKI